MDALVHVYGIIGTTAHQQQGFVRHILEFGNIRLDDNFTQNGTILGILVLVQIPNSNGTIGSSHGHSCKDPKGLWNSERA